MRELLGLGFGLVSGMGAGLFLVGIPSLLIGGNPWQAVFFFALVAFLAGFLIVGLTGSPAFPVQYAFVIPMAMWDVFSLYTLIQGPVSREEVLSVALWWVSTAMAFYLCGRGGHLATRLRKRKG